MALFETLRAIHEYTRHEQNAYHANNQKLLLRLGDVIWRTWDLGFTAFGGPPVHFRILHQRFVDGQGGLTPWIDEQTVLLNLRCVVVLCGLYSASIRSCSRFVRLCQVRPAPK